MARVNLGLGECKETITEGMEKLRRVIEEAEGLSFREKIKYEKAIVHMGLARVLLNKVPCLQPWMSFDIAGYRAARKPAAAKNRRRKR